MQNENYSVLRPNIVRPLPIALAQILSNAKPGDGRLPALNRLYSALSPADKLRCQDEMRWCRLAKRGATPARVA